MEPQINTDGHRFNLISEKIIGCAFTVSNTLGVGEYFADILVNQQIVIETKAVQSLNEIHQAQLLNYLKASRLPLGLLINFGSPKVQIKRMLNDK